MTITQEEIFGPVLAVIPNDTKKTPSASLTTACTVWRAMCVRFA
jgi:hypothetical protein